MTINLPFPIAPSAPLVGPSNQTFSAVASDIRLRADLLPSCVAIKFRIVSTVNGQQQISIISDLATTISGETVEGIGYEASLCPVATFLTEPGTYLDSTDQSALLNASLAPAVKSACIDMEGGNQNLCIFNTIPVNTGDPASDLAALAMWQFLCPQLATAASITQVSGSAVTAVDDFGNTLDLTKYAYILLDNAFTAMEDRAAALTWADSWDPWFLHRKLERFAHPYYPILKQVNEAAYASDSVFAGGPAGQSETGTGETRHHRRTGSSKINPEPPATIAWQHRQSLRIPTCHNSLYERC